MTSTSQVLESPPSSSTPILDRIIPLQALPRSRWKSELLRALLGAAVAFLLAFVVYAVTHRTLKYGPVTHLTFKHGLSVWTLILLVANVILFGVSVYLAIIIHETGHMIAGLCSGYRVDFVRFGPIQINPPFRVSRAPKFGVYLPGAASLFPPRKDRVHARAVVFVLGGPLANLISAGCVLLLPRPLPGFAIWFAGVSLLLGLMNLMPFVVSGAASDGKRILMILAPDAPRRTLAGDHPALRRIVGWCIAGKPRSGNAGQGNGCCRQASGYGCRLSRCLCSRLSPQQRCGSCQVAGNSLAILPLYLAPVETRTHGACRCLPSHTRRPG